MGYLLQHLLSESAQIWPDREAVVFEGEKLTFRDLEQRSNRLARLLVQRGVQRGHRVGICMPRSPGAIVSLFGILKAGAVYVPLDPLAPPARLAHMISDCGIRCLVTCSDKIGHIAKVVADRGPLDLLVKFGDKILPALPNQPAHQVVAFSEHDSDNSELCPSIATIDTDLAYILYTSGSTGDPKGVMLTHLNALTFINWAHARFGINHHDCLANHAPLHFDLSVFDIFVAIEAGAPIAIVPDGLSLFPTQLAQFIEANRVSVWYSVPSVLTLLTLFGELDRHDLHALRLVLFAGEVFPIKYLRRLMQLVPQAKYYNLYGPTETNVCTYYHVSELPAEHVKTISIGKACENIEVFALDAAGHVVNQPGQEGELYVRGSTVTPGYWGRPGKTANVVLPNPWRPDTGDRIYRTGDLVTLDADGNYIFLGRKDQMVKSRGYRIELGEIETVLYSHPAVKEAAVVPFPDDLVGNRIYAYVVLHPEASVEPEELRRYCAESLPVQMIPETVELKSSLPRTSSGKTDRQLLAKTVSAKSGPLVGMNRGSP